MPTRLYNDVNKLFHCFCIPFLTALFYRNALEGYDKPDGELDSSVDNLHNLVHSFLNGTSALSHSAANDPIFLVII